MNNEVKARAIIGEDCKKENCLQCGGRYSAEEGGCATYQKIMQMAQWKDEQYNSTELKGFIDIIAVKLLYFMSKNNYSVNDKNWDKIREGFLEYIKNQ